MLGLMRRHAKSWFIKFLLGLVAVVFIFWGVGSYSANQGARVALVDGEIVSVAEFQKTYRDLVEQARRQFGDFLNEELLKKLNLRQQALDKIISQRLILNEADRENVIIVDDALLAAIHAEPAFQEDGRFSPSRYNRLLAAIRMDKAEYEAATRRELAVGRMQGRVAMTGLVSVTEAKYFYHWQRDQIKISYVAFNPESYTSRVEPDEKAVAAFYESNKEAYRKPEKVDVQYLAFEPKDYLDKVTLPEGRALEIYNITLESYQVPARVKLGHIFLTVPVGADKAEADKVKALAEKIAQQAREGADFAELAKAYSKGPEAAKGGETDWLTKDQLSDDLEKAAFGLKIGQVSDPIRSPGGYHVIKVLERQEERTKKFSEVKDEIERSLKMDAAGELALAAAEEAYGLSADIDDLAKLAERVGKKVQTTGLFSRQDPPPGPAADQRFIEAAFLQPVGEVGAVVELKEGYFLLLVKKRVPSFIPDLKDVAEQVRADYINDEARKLAKAEAEAFLKEAKSQPWLALAKDKGHNVELPPAFNRNGRIEGLGYDQALTEAAFRLTAKKPLPDSVFEVGGKYVVIHFEDRLKASEEVFEKNKAQYVKGLQQRRRQIMTAGWLKALRRKAEIEIDQRFL